VPFGIPKSLTSLKLVHLMKPRADEGIRRTCAAEKAHPGVSRAFSCWQRMCPGVKSRFAVMLLCMLIEISYCFADIETQSSTADFSRGYSDVVNCNGAWVRGKGKLTSDGSLLVSLALETDSIIRGAAGWVGFEVKDKDGLTLANGNTDTRSIPPKDPGPARRVDFPPFERKIPAGVASRATSIIVSAHCADAPFGLWDIHLSASDIASGIKLILYSDAALNTLSSIGKHAVILQPSSDTFSAALTQLDGRFLNVESGNGTFVTDSGVQLALENLNNLGTNSSAFPAIITVSGAGRAPEISNTTFKYITELDHVIKDLPTGPSRDRLESLRTSLISQTPLWVASDSLKELKNASVTTSSAAEELVNVFSSMSPDDQRKNLPILGPSFLELRKVARISAQKTVYGYDDQFQPLTYKQIFERSASVGSLKFDDEQVGSCFLFEKDRILTCMHCLQDGDKRMRDVAEFTVTFERDTEEKKESRTFPVTKPILIGPKGQIGSLCVPALDFAVLELGRDKAGKTVEEEGWEPLPISKTRVERDAAVCVIGFPGLAPKMVADNSHIFIPYDTTNQAHDAYRLQLAGEMEQQRRDADNLANSGEKAEALRHVQRLRDQLSTRFDGSFVEITSPGNESRWLFTSQFLMASAHPAFALDSDTFHGDSGAPVFLRKTGKVIGLFFRGYFDVNVAKVSWESHEEGIPISVILDAYEANKANTNSQAEK
jgi:V8-like Glu-specific endopeptidase